MTDSRLRELERRWKETGSVEDETAYLLERVRVGELKENMLELAAICGHQAAYQAFEGHAPLIGEEFIRFLDEGLDAWGQDACSRAAIASALLTLKVTEQTYPHNPRPRQALKTSVAWAICPCEKHMKAAEAAAQAADDHVANDPGAAADVAMYVVGRGLKRAIREVLIGWALGYEDPLIKIAEELEGDV